MFLLLLRLCCTALCLSAYRFALYYEAMQQDREAVFLLAFLASLVFSFIYLHQTHTSLMDTISLLMLGASLSPVLGTLTSSYASNTVNFLSLLAFIIHLFFSDNTTTGGGDSRAPHSAISFNAAFAGILLQASRFHSSAAALSFTFTVFCTALLLFLPQAACRSMGAVTEDAGSSFAQNQRRRALLSAMMLLSIYFLAQWYGARLALAFALLLVFVGHVAPEILFARVPHEKLRGPWDLLRLDKVVHYSDAWEEE